MRLIEEDTEDVIVPYGDAKAQAKVQSAINDLRRQEGSARGALRQLQPYLVSVRKKLPSSIGDKAGSSRFCLSQNSALGFGVDCTTKRVG